MRVARPTVELDRIRSFYEHVVGLPLLGAFVDHDGFDGVIFGLPDARAQLELVRSPHGDIPVPTNEDALVLYCRSGVAATELVDRLQQAGTAEVTDDPVLNPYWPRRGARCYVDPDGYRLIVVPGLISARGRDMSPGASPPEETGLRVVPTGPERDRYLPLLSLADDSPEQIRGYYQTGTLFALDDGDGGPIGMILAIEGPDRVVELKAVAVDPSLHGQGVGTRLLRAVLERLRVSGARRVIVGTSSSGIGQLAYYQKAGFRLQVVERDFFSPERGYAEGIEENGIPLRDMVWMDQSLVMLDDKP